MVIFIFMSKIFLVCHNIDVFYGKIKKYWSMESAFQEDWFAKKRVVDKINVSFIRIDLKYFSKKC